MTSSAKQQLVDTLKAEHARTTRVLEAFPESASELRPHPTSQATREVVHTMCVEAMVGSMALDGSLDLSTLKFPPPPATWSEVLGAFRGSYDRLFAVLEAAPESALDEMTTFMVGPGQFGEMTKAALVQFMLLDHIHHRGQLSVYLRMSGSKVPSIYGPSKDEPWS